MAVHLREDIDAVEPDTSRRRHVARWVIVTTIAVVGLAAAVVVAFLVRDDESNTTATTPRQSTGPVVSTPSSPATAPTTPTSTPTVDTFTAVWPRAGSTLRYHDPEAAAKGYAIEFLGFRDPVVGQYMAGDVRSGEVNIKPSETGPTTTVFVRQLGSSSDWWVVGSSAPNIQLTTPTALDTIASPLHLAGSSTAFEGQIDVRIYADGVDSPLAQSSVMGGSMGEMRPFDATIEFPASHASGGTVVVYTVSMEDGTTAEASAVRVQFAGS